MEGLFGGTRSLWLLMSHKSSRTVYLAFDRKAALLSGKDRILFEKDLILFRKDRIFSIPPDFHPNDLYLNEPINK